MKLNSRLCGVESNGTQDCAKVGDLDALATTNEEAELLLKI